MSDKGSRNVVIVGGGTASWTSGATGAAAKATRLERRPGRPAGVDRAAPRSDVGWTNSLAGFAKIVNFQDLMH
jgi:hypothetical protein